MFMFLSFTLIKISSSDLEKNKCNAKRKQTQQVVLDGLAKGRKNKLRPRPDQSVGSSGV